jgi:hypothetical protein
MPTSNYQRPGVYIEHENRQVLASFGGLPRSLCIVGTASRSKIVQDEVVRRGYVTEETIVPDVSSPHQAELDYTSNQVKSDTVVFQDDVEIDPDAWDYDDATHITVKDFGWTGGSIWTISYQSATPNPTTSDPVEQSIIEGISLVGTYPRVASYTQGTDYQLTSNTIDWSLAGSEPDLDTLYYASYTYTREATDYNIPKQAFSLDDVLNDVGGLDATNFLGIAAQIAFQQDIPFVWYCQVEDSNDDGVYTVADYQNGIDGCKLKEELTDVVVVTPNSLSDSDYDLLAAYLRSHVEDESNMYRKHERIGWFGRRVNTDIGDKSTAYTFIYTATLLLAANANSAARGRLILVGPSWVKKTLQMESGTELTMTLDSSFLAVAIAAKQNSFDSVADSLTRKTVIGYDAIEEWSPEEVDHAAANGVCVVSNVGGLQILLDPMTTEQNAGVIEFKEISAMTQKDLLTKRMRDYLDNNIIGIVPDDLADFLWDIKAAIVIVLKASISDGTIAPFSNDDGTLREIDTTKDIDVKRDVTDATKYIFKYWYNLRYPAKRLFGTYTVDTPFYQQKA